MPDESSTFAIRRQLTAGPDQTEPAGAVVSAGYGMTATGEDGGSFSREPASPLRRYRKPPRQPAASPETRAALRVAWRAACSAADALILAIKEGNAEGRYIAVDDVEEALGKLWALREVRDDYWQMILNHGQGMLRQLFQQNLVERLTEKQGEAIRVLVEERLGPATKTRDDLVEALRVIEDAGCDPYYAISGDPEEEGADPASGES